jgi:hypothetical protein
VEAEPPGADNTGGRSEGKVTTVQAPAKPAKRRVYHLRVTLALVVCVLAVSCGERTAPSAPDRDRRPVGAWPTRGWRTGAPQDQGLDPKVLAGIDDARLTYPTLRSVLVVRHGVLVVERYYSGRHLGPARVSQAASAPASRTSASKAWLHSTIAP